MYVSGAEGNRQPLLLLQARRPDPAYRKLRLAVSATFTVNDTANLADPEAEIMEYFCIEHNQYGLPGGITNPPPAGQ